jgi:uncharacterized protein (DUF58 family)
MTRPSREAAAVAERFELALDSAPPPGRSGERLARSGGAGTEFHDSRPYQLGDDVRSIDWRAFARSDQLMVRVWREELLARVEVLLDVSRSMGIDPRKAQFAVDLAQVFALSAQRNGSSARIVPVGARSLPLAPDEFEARGVEFDSREPFDAGLREALEHVRRGCVVLVVSDFLFPHAPRELLAPLATRAGALGCVQVLSQDERAPQPGRALRLVDCENDASLDLVLDARVVEGYLARLAALNAALSEECRRAGARFASLGADAPLDELARGPLLEAGLLAAR